jgi:hypothetical protein
MQSRNPRRIVTGHDASNSSIISLDDEAHSFPIASLPGLVFREIWQTSSTPAPIDSAADAVPARLQLCPPKHGSVIRILDIPPDGDADAHGGAAHFEELGAGEAATSTGNSPHPNMHKTATIDYGILIEGELWLILDKDEVRLQPGDVVVQRGTNHAWSNRSDRNARIAFILIDGVSADS